MNISISHVTFSYPSALNPVFKDISLAMQEGWYAFVGDNGAGKSTLAKLICGQLTPESGTITKADLLTLYCEQDSDLAPYNLEDLASDWTAHGQNCRQIFDLDERWLWDFDHCSLGQKKRVQLACALYSEPDVLVLDEPSNHIDVETKQSLIQALKGYKGIGIVISHDRALIDKLCNHVVLCEQGKITLRNGIYSEVAKNRKLEHEQTERNRQAAKHELARLERERARRVNLASQQDAKRSKANIDPKDKSAKGKIDLAIYTGKDGVAGKLSKRLDNRIQGAQDKLSELFVQKRYSGSIEPFGTRLHSKYILKLEEQDVPYFDVSLESIHIPELYIGPQDRIALVGANGLGKSTLISKILRMLSEDLNYFYMPQSYSAEEELKQIKKLQSLSQADKGSVLSRIAQLNSDPESFIDAQELSPGELRKLALSLASLEDPTLLVLDEPTNHLDMHSIEALEEFLQNYVGVLIMVTHDEYVVEHVATRVWRLVQSEGGSKLIEK